MPLAPLSLQLDEASGASRTTASTPDRHSADPVRSELVTREMDAGPDGLPTPRWLTVYGGGGSGTAGLTLPRRLGELGEARHGVHAVDVHGAGRVASEHGEISYV